MEIQENAVIIVKAFVVYHSFLQFLYKIHIDDVFVYHFSQEERAQLEASGGPPGSYAPAHKDGGPEPWRDPNYGRGWERRDDYPGGGREGYGPPHPAGKEGEWSGGEPWKGPAAPEAGGAEPVWEEDGWIWDEREQVRVCACAAIGHVMMLHLRMRRGLS